VNQISLAELRQFEACLAIILIKMQAIRDGGSRRLCDSEARWKVINATHNLGLVLEDVSSAIAKESQ